MNLLSQFATQAIFLTAAPYFRHTCHRMGGGIPSALGIVSILSFQVSLDVESRSFYWLSRLSFLALTFFASTLVLRMKGSCPERAFKVVTGIAKLQIPTALALYLFSQFLGPYRFRCHPILVYDDIQDFDDVQNFDPVQHNAHAFIDVFSETNGDYQNNPLLRWLSYLTGIEVLELAFKISSSFRNNNDAAPLAVFMSKWFDFREQGKIGGHSNEFVAEKLVEYLERAAKDPVFQNQFWMIIEDLNCVDSFALALLKVDIRYQLAKTSPNQTEEIFTLLVNGIWTISELELGHAEIIILKAEEENKNCDEVEVGLKYVFSLKEVLEIPIDIKEMAFNAEEVTDNDLELAKEDILRKREKGAFYPYLIGEDKWLEVIQHRFPEEYQKAYDERAEKSASSEFEVVQAMEVFKEKMIGLSKELLEGSSAAASSSSSSTPAPKLEPKVVKIGRASPAEIQGVLNDLRTALNHSQSKLLVPQYLNTLLCRLGYTEEGRKAFKKNPDLDDLSRRIDQMAPDCPDKKEILEKLRAALL